jgi:glycosyltransferase involved in cell wall biosynthesis
MPIKKVMHITYDMRIGGTEMVIKNLIDGADKSQYKLSVLCIESPLGPFSEDLIKDGVIFHQLNRQPGFDKALVKNIRKIIKQNNIDIIHCHQYTPWVYGVIAALMTCTKVMFTEHGRFHPDSSTWKRKLINPVLNNFTAQVTVISKATKKALVEFENIPAKDIDVIYNGIAPLSFDAAKAQALRQFLNIPDNHTILGTVARFDPIKNHTMMLKAFAKVLSQQPNCTLLIVGDGDERQNIENCITQLKISENVILAGYQAKPAEHIALMDLFLLSSLSEGTSMTLLEAMSMGKPCVVTDAGGNPEIICHNVNGIVTLNDNIEMFADAIKYMLQDTDKFKRYSQAASEIFKQQFTANSMIKKYEELYKSVLKQKKINILQSK